MLVIRPIRESDFPELYKIAEESGIGFTSLPVNEELLKLKISHSQESFEKKVLKPGDETYLMVAEDTETGEVVGTTALEGAVGTESPFYTYHLGKVVHSSPQLGVYNLVETLTLTNDYTGVSELCTLFLRESFRQGHNGRLLSKCRFLFLAEFADRFSDKIIAEMRGVSDEEGRSPFWQWLEYHFFSVDFPTADYLTGLGNKQFIAELMPKYPIYVNLLSPQAQQVIGQVHEKTRPALRLLEKEGFHSNGYVDIFDAGPTVECNLNQIHSVRNCKRLQVSVGEPVHPTDHLISNIDLEGFRSCVAKISVSDEQHKVVISSDVAKALNVAEGDTVRVLAL